MNSRIEQIRWPLATLDFEASALGRRGYPIEVGIAIWPSFDAAIEVWSTLIRPTAGWLEGGDWNAEAQATHGIQLSDLDSGMTPAETMSRLNELVQPPVCWCDGGWQDESWLSTLSHAAGIAPKFKLGDWDALTGCLGPEGYRRMIEWTEAAPTNHRAGDDARRLLRAIAVALGASGGKDLSGLAVQAFEKIAREWALSVAERAAILGGRDLRSRSSLTDDELHRVSYLIGIYKDINMLIPINSRASKWLRAKNGAFNGNSALDHILSNGITGLSQVRRYLSQQVN